MKTTIKVTPAESAQTAEPTNVSAEAKEGEKQAKNGDWEERLSDQNKAVSKHLRDNVISNYGSKENFMAQRTAEIREAEEELLSYRENIHKGGGQRASKIVNLQERIRRMKQGLNEVIEAFAEITPQSSTAPPTAPDEPTIHPTAETPTERKGTANPTIKKNLQVGGGATIPNPQRLEKFGNTLLHIAHVGKMVAPANRLRSVAYVPRDCSTANAPSIGSTR